MTEYEIIDKIRPRTGMYIGCLSPTHLHSFLHGYFLEINDDAFIPEKPSFHGFHQWVANKFDYREATSGWAHMIEDQRVDKEEALYLFYDLLDEYRGIKHQQIAKIIFDHEDKIDRSWRGYSRLKKVRGSFEAVFKPSPKEIIIRKMNIPGEWFQMLGTSDCKDILFAWHWNQLEKVYKRATAIFGIEECEWTIEN